MGRFRLLLIALAAASALTLVLNAGPAAAMPRVGPHEGDRGVATEPVSPPDLAPIVRGFDDVGGSYGWAKNAIAYVAKDRLWMRDFGDDEFKPGKTESRALLARTMVRAFGSGEAVDPSTVFSDLPASDPFYDFANIAVQNGWMRTDGDRFKPDGPVDLHTLYRALVTALPLQDEIAGLDDLHTQDGTRFDQPWFFPTTNIGMRLLLRYNHPQEGKDVVPDDPLPRAEVAYALWKAKTVPGYKFDEMRRFRAIELPNMSGAQRKIIEWDAKHVGYPYIWGGEWFKKNGSQPTGGWDCSGFMWWSMKRATSWYKPPGRPYNGWSLPQRASRDMAANGKRIAYNNLKPGDLMFYDGTEDGVVDHVDMYAGNGFAFDTGSSVGGTSMLYVGPGSWYRDHFKWGRRII